MNDQRVFIVESRGTRSVWLAAVLSLFLPGTGQIYCRQDNKGVFLAGVFLLGHWLTGGLSSLLLCPAMMLDAAMIARKLNRGSAVERWEFFPGIKFLNSLAVEAIPITIVMIIVLITLAHLVAYGSDYLVGQ